MTAVGLVVPTRAGAGRLAVLLDSLSLQTSRDFEVVVVVDGDVDGTEALLTARGARGDVPLRTVVLPENRGRSAALNAGFAVVDGEVVGRVDDDLDLPPTYVADLVRLHAARPAGVVGLCRNLFPDESPASRAYARAYGRRADARARAASYAESPDRAWQHWGASASLRREVHLAVGGYDEGFAHYGWEDVDFGYRVHLLGLPVHVEPSLEAGHRLAATTTLTRSRRAYLSGASQARFEDKHGIRVTDRGEHAPGWWGRAVRTAARGLDLRAAERRAARVDAQIPFLPQTVSRRAIALAVESAGLAGYRSARPPSEGDAPCPPP